MTPEEMSFLFYDRFARESLSASMRNNYCDAVNNKEVWANYWLVKEGPVLENGSTQP
jgi:hypothetical protein